VDAISYLIARKMSKDATIRSAQICEGFICAICVQFFPADVADLVSRRWALIQEACKE